jgi:hypothetical protein
MSENPTRRLDQPEQGQPCAKCRGKRVWAEALVRRDPIVLAPLGADTLLGFVMGPSTDCKALVCIDCGFTELYAAQPKAVLREW